MSSLINWIFILVWTGSLQATQAAKIQFKLEKKNPVHQIWHFKNQAQIDGENHTKVLWTLWQYLPGNPDLLIIFPTISSCVFCSFYCFLHQCFHDVRLSTHAMAYQILYLGSWKEGVKLSLNFEKGSLHIRVCERILLHKQLSKWLKTWSPDATTNFEFVFDLRIFKNSLTNKTQVNIFVVFQLSYYLDFDSL